jgi:hypothetical protein
MHTIPIATFNTPAPLLHAQDEVDSLLNKGGADVNARGEEHDAIAITSGAIRQASRKPA